MCPYKIEKRNTQYPSRKIVLARWIHRLKSTTIFSGYASKDPNRLLMKTKNAPDIRNDQNNQFFAVGRVVLALYNPSRGCAQRF